MFSADLLNNPENLLVKRTIGAAILLLKEEGILMRGKDLELLLRQPVLASVPRPVLSQLLPSLSGVLGPLVRL